MWEYFSKTPHQGLESSFCCWIARRRLAPKECFCSQTPVWQDVFGQAASDRLGRTEDAPVVVREDVDVGEGQRQEGHVLGERSQI